MVINTRSSPQVFYHQNQPISLEPGSVIDDEAYPECRSSAGLKPVNLWEHLKSQPEGTKVVFRRTRSMVDSVSVYEALGIAAKAWPSLRFEAVLHPEASKVVAKCEAVTIRTNNFAPPRSVYIHANYVSGCELAGPVGGAAAVAKIFGLKLDGRDLVARAHALLAEQAESALGTADMHPEAIASAVEQMQGLAAPCLEDLPAGSKVLIFRRWGGLGDQVMLGMTVADMQRQFPNLAITVSVPRAFLGVWEQHGVKLVPAERLTSRYLWQFSYVRDCSRACSEFAFIERKEKVTTHRAQRWAKHIGFELKSFESPYRPNEAQKAWAETKLLPRGSKPRVGISPSSVCSWRAYPHTKELVQALAAAGYQPVLLHTRQVDTGGYGIQPKIDTPEHLGAVIGALDALICIPSAPFCFANVLHVPTVAIFGTEDPDAFRHAFPECTFLSKDLGRGCPCWGAKAQNCLSKDRIADCHYISVEEVMSVLRQKLSPTRKCVCGLVPELIGSKEGMRLARCTCGVIVSVDVPNDQASYMTLYSGPDYHNTHQIEVGHVPYTERWEHDTKIASGRLKAIKKHKRKGHLLDIGCSNGAFVASATLAGFDAGGFEVNPKIAEFARSMGVQVTVAESLASAGWDPGIFDVVTSHDVFEHYLDPGAELEEQRRILATGGLLVIDTPDAGLYDERRLDYHHLRPREHVYLHTESSLRAIVSKHGFMVKQIARPLAGKLVCYATKL